MQNPAIGKEPPVAHSQRQFSQDPSREKNLPMFLGGVGCSQMPDFSIAHLEFFTVLIDPSVPFIEGIGNLPTAEKHLLATYVGHPIKIAGHPYFVFQFHDDLLRYFYLPYLSEKCSSGSRALWFLLVATTLFCY
jgi:hypothetical protein